jgi:UDP:flavonoid glycosyltransferase YjiC (YdhE family)
MGRALLIWEMGAGLGHLMRLRPVAAGLVERGHAVAVASRAWTDASARWFPGVQHLTTPPALTRPEATPGRTYHGLPAILEAVGWADPDDLTRQADAWHRWLAQAQADVLVLDYAPTALLAAQPLGVPIVMLSTGFTCPPDRHPLPTFGLAADPRITDGCHATEARVLAAVNHVLRRQGQPALRHLAALFTRVHAHYLTTWPELDHYGPRAAATYVGSWPGVAGPCAEWPPGDGPRAVGYLQPFPQLGTLLEMLDRAQMPCLLHVAGGGAHARPPRGDHLRILDEPFDLPAAAREADLAILHGGLGGTTAALLAGLPALLLPRHAEQLMLARRVADLGAGRLASPEHAGQIAAALQALLVEPRYEQAARRFATTHAGFDPDAAVRRVVEAVSASLQGPADA